MFKKIVAWFNREPVSLDRLDGVDVVIPCPPSHGSRCNCTWY